MDIAIIETGNGGDISIKGNDVDIVNGIENMPYLGMFGGNVEQSTSNRVTSAQSFDYWANNLFYYGDQSRQMNSTVERILQQFEVSSKGRIKFEEAIKKDLDFLNALATQQVVVTVVSDDRIQVRITIMQNVNEEVIIINFKKAAIGDFWILDFNDDFLV